MIPKTFYFLGLLILAISIFLLVEYPQSGRINMIAGALTAVGFGFNLSGYLMLQHKLKKAKS